MTYQPTFPAALQPAASALLRVLSEGELSYSLQGFQVLVQGELLSAPSRVYCKLRQLQSGIETSAGDARTLALCLGSRHCDGYEREYCLRQLLVTDPPPWTVPFIIELLGEYVIEIVEAIAVALAGMNAARFTDFATENPQFMATTRRRATSYWSCYHRARFPMLQNYPAILALQAIEQRVQRA